MGDEGSRGAEVLNVCSPVARSVDSTAEQRGLASAMAITLLRVYKRFLSPLLPRACRFSPTCSEYAMLSFRQDGFFVALGKTAWRLARCQPFSRGGIDLP